MELENTNRKLVKSGQIINLMRPIISAMNRAGYYYSIRYDLDEWARVRKAMTPEQFLLASTFDPTHCDQSQSYWIEVRDRVGDIAAVIAARHFETVDFVEMQKSGKIWSDNPRFGRLNLCFPDDFNLSGSFVYRGGLCVKKSHRKKGLSWILPRLVALFSIDRGTDYIVSHNLEELYASGFSGRVYGHTGSILCFDGSQFFPPSAEKRRAYLVWTDLDSAITNARRDFEILDIAGSSQKLSDLAVLAQRPNNLEKTPRVAKIGFLDKRKTG